tara:strand:- start:490 stop:726 length:237 start_codon:yes stop_codon:yes gene_type:complete
MTKIYRVDAPGQPPRFFADRGEAMGYRVGSLEQPSGRWQEFTTPTTAERLADMLNARVINGMEFAARLVEDRAEELDQ